MPENGFSIPSMAGTGGVFGVGTDNAIRFAFQTTRAASRKGGGLLSFKSRGVIFGDPHFPRGPATPTTEDCLRQCPGATGLLAQGQDTLS